MMTNIFVAALILAAGRFPLPPTFSVRGDLRQDVDVMLAHSATLRQQCERLAGCPVYVRISRDLCLRDKPFRARSTILRTVEGPIIATIVIGPVGSAAEWIGHELEHVIEQVEGVRLKEIAVGNRGAWRSGEESFETERAIAVGRRVAAEVRASMRAARRERWRADTTALTTTPSTSLGTTPSASLGTTPSASLGTSPSTSVGTRD
jgi:hypothetical protein